MATIERFEDIQAWQKARELTRFVYGMTKREAFSSDWDLQRQVRRASVSSMANIAEGFARKSNKEFANYLNMARASAAEVQSHLYVAIDQNYITPEDFETCYSLCEDCTRLIRGFQNYLADARVAATAGI